MSGYDQKTQINEIALSDQLMAEIQQSIQLRINLLRTQRDLADANAKIKELEEKYEPK